MGLLNLLFGKTEKTRVVVQPSPKSVDEILRDIEAKKNENIRAMEESRRQAQIWENTVQEAMPSFKAQLQKYEQIVTAISSGYLSPEEVKKLELGKIEVVSQLEKNPVLRSTYFHNEYHPLKNTLLRDIRRKNEDAYSAKVTPKQAKEAIKALEKRIVECQSGIPSTTSTIEESNGAIIGHTPSTNVHDGEPDNPVYGSSYRTISVPLSQEELARSEKMNNEINSFQEKIDSYKRVHRL